MKTDDERKQMAQSHRFKKEREFKQRITEQESNEDADIRTFTFHHHDLNEQRHNERGKRDYSERGMKPFKNREKKDYSDRPGNDWGDRKDRFSKSFDKSRQKGKDNKFNNTNRGGHERFDRSGGKRNNKRFNRNED